MTKKTFSFLYCIMILCCAAACHTESKEPFFINSDPTFLQTPQTRTLSSIIESYRLIPLETNEESLIGNITKIIKYDDKFYISSLFGKKLYLFDNEGKFLGKLDRAGNGPGEYAMLMDFDVADKQIIILDGSKMNFYTNEPEPVFIKSIDLDFVPMNIKSIGDHKYFLYALNRQMLCHIIDEQGKILNQGMPTDQMRSTLNALPFLSPDPNLIITHYGNSNDLTGYDIKKNAFSPLNVFKEGAMTAKTEQEYIRRYGANYGEQVDTDMIIQLATDSDKLMAVVCRAYKNHKYYISDVADKKLHYLITKNTKNDITYTNINFLLRASSAFSKDGFISYIDPYVLWESLSKNTQYADEENYRTLQEKFVQGAPKEDENPVLIELKFK